MNEQVMPDTMYILELCAVMENSFAEIYDLFAAAFGDYPEAAATFRKTAAEERNHEYQFRVAIRNYVPEISSILPDREQAEKFLQSARDLLDSIRKEVPSIDEAFKMSIAYEKMLRGFHMDAVVMFKEPSLSKLFRAMMDGDDKHIETLEKAHAAISG